MRESLRCRVRRHDWRICSVTLAGHQSERSRRCDRCFDHGRLLVQTQERGYYGEDVDAPWITTTDERGRVTDGRFVPSPAASSEEGDDA